MTPFHSGKGLWFGTLAALSGHVLVLALVTGSSAPAIQTSGAKGLRPLNVRQIALAPPVRPIAPPQPAAPVAIKPADKPLPSVPQPTADTTTDIAVNAMPAASAASNAVASEGAPSDSAMEADYLPSAQLDAGPTPLTPIDIPFPDSVSGMLNVRFQLSLFIDEAGQVQRVRIDTPAPDPALEEAAMNAFRYARFTPGQLQGVAVRSLVRIEVTYETVPLPPLSPQAAQPAAAASAVR